MGQVIHLLPTIDRAIWNKVDKGAKPLPGRRGKCTVPAETILAMRRAHEIERKTIQQVKDQFPQYSNEYVRSVLSYLIRANLRVKL